MGLENIRIVLASPIYGGNVGSTCRAMANMGLSDLAIAAPRPINMDEAHMLACHATDILYARKEFPDIPSAVADCHLVFGTTARPGLYRQHARTPRDWAAMALTASGHGRVAFVFGREDNGLTTEELAVCNHIVRIPSADEYKSLNVAQAVMLCCYELFLATESFEPPQEKSPGASTFMKERMFEMWRDTLLRIGFMKEDKADHMMYGLRRIFGRGAATEDDVNILMGISRQTIWASEHGGDTPRRKGKPVPPSA